MKCRHCASNLDQVFVDLGVAPPSNAYLEESDLTKPEKWYPLRALVCGACWLVQTEDYADRSELFSKDYAYFSSFSTSWLAHAKTYVDSVLDRLELKSGSMVVEIAANDGYLLQYMKERGIPCIGIEPTRSTAAACRSKGIEVIEEFFGSELASRLALTGFSADLLIANNVLAHVPLINDFARGFATLMKPEGVATFEFPHILKLVTLVAFDTIYHEHYSYLSLTSVLEIFERNGLTIFEVEQLETHGGSLRVYAQRSDGGRRQISRNVEDFLSQEDDAGIRTREFYAGFQERAIRIKNDFLRFLIDARQAGRRVGGYGAAAKGNTLINYAGVRSDLLPWVADRNPTKQGKFLPGSRIPVVAEEFIRRQKPDYVWIIPWNLRRELLDQLGYIREWGGRFVIAVPELEII